MDIRKYLQGKPVRRGTKRMMINFTRMIEEIDNLEKQSSGSRDEEVRDLQEKLPEILGLIELARFELVMATHPLRNQLHDEDEVRKKLVSATGIRSPKCSQ